MNQRIFKNINRNSSAILLLFLSILFLVSFTACEMPLAEFDKEAAGTTGGTVYVSLAGNAASSRTVTVNAPLIAAYTLLGSLNSGTETTLGTWTDISKASLELETGDWAFKLAAYDGSGNMILSGNLSVTLSAATVLNFTLRALEKSTGTVNVTILWPSNSDVYSVETIYAGAIVSNTTVSGWSLNGEQYGLNYTKSQADSGNHKLVFKLRNEAGTLLASVAEMVQVRDSLTSSKTITLESSTVNAKPNAPTDISYTARTSSNGNSYTNVEIYWVDASLNENKFVIESSLNGSSWSEAGEVSAGTTSYVVENAERETDIYFRVKAVNDFGDSGYVTSAAINVPALVTYKITYCANDGSGGTWTDTTEYVEGNEVNPSYSGYNRADYDLYGWSTSAFGRVETSYTIDRDLVLYARWNHVNAEAYGNFTYTTEESTETVAITAYNGSSSALIVPNLINNYPVKSINISSSGVTSVNLGDSISSVPTCFRGITNITELEIDTHNPDFSTAGGVLYNKTKTTLLIYPIGNSATAFTIPDSVTMIGEYAFSNAEILRNVTNMDQVLYLDVYAFFNAKGLESIDELSSIISMGDAAFHYCTGLSKITVGETIRYMNRNVFDADSNLSVYMNATVPPDTGENAYSDTIRVYVPYSADHSVLAAYEHKNGFPWAGKFYEMDNPDASTPPSEMTAVSVDNTSRPENALVKLSWKDNSDNETGFKIQYSDDNKTTWTTVISRPANTETVTIGTDRGANRYYRICAVNSSGDSAYCESSRITIPYIVVMNDVKGGFGYTTEITYAEVMPGGTIIFPPDPYRKSCVFNGWYTEIGGKGTEYTSDSAVNGNLNLYGKWTINMELMPYNIYYQGTDAKEYTFKVTNPDGEEIVNTTAKTNAGFNTYYGTSYGHHPVPMVQSIPYTVEIIFRRDDGDYKYYNDKFYSQPSYCIYHNILWDAYTFTAK